MNVFIDACDAVTAEFLIADYNETFEQKARNRINDQTQLYVPPNGIGLQKDQIIAINVPSVTGTTTTEAASKPDQSNALPLEVDLPLIMIFILAGFCCVGMGILLWKKREDAPKQKKILKGTDNKELQMQLLQQDNQGDAPGMYGQTSLQSEMLYDNDSLIRGKEIKGTTSKGGPEHRDIRKSQHGIEGRKSRIAKKLSEDSEAFYDHELMGEESEDTITSGWTISAPSKVSNMDEDMKQDMIIDDNEEQMTMGDSLIEADKNLDTNGFIGDENDLDDEELELGSNIEQPTID